VNPLIDVAELTVALASADPPVLLDVRWSLRGDGPEQYEAGHVPGAGFLDLDAQLAGPPGKLPGPGGGRHPLPAPEELQDALRTLGVREGHPVVVYDGGGPHPTGAAARAWWVLRWAGHDAVRVLDGGYEAWVAAGSPVTTDTIERPRGDVTVRPGSVPVLAAPDAAVLAAAGALIDARVAPRYLGEAEPVDPVAGHIPGALNQPAADTVGPDGRLLPPAELRARFTALGLPTPGSAAPGSAAVNHSAASGSATPGAYCGSGVTAAHTVLALTVAGYDPALYVGSWSEWITDPSRPIATGHAGQAGHAGDAPRATGDAS
jgi:thiosulfate/3-mercaptopyruvate sulfurtransferase